MTIKTWYHVIVIAYFLVGGLLAAGIAGHIYASRSKHAMAPAVFTAVMSALAVFLFGVILTTVVRAKLDYDGRVAVARRDHLERLRPLLRTEATNLGEVTARLDAEGSFFDPNPFGGINYTTLWQEGNNLLGDLVNHFQDYTADRAKLKAALLEHDNAYGKLKS